MLATADEVVRSLRGTADLLNRKPGALGRFDTSERGFWRSFGAIWLAAPAVVIALALERGREDLVQAGLFRFDHVTLAVVAGALASFLVVPLAMIAVARRLHLTRGYVPFVVVTNWILVVAFLVLSFPGLLLLLGLSTPGLAVVHDLAFGAVLVHLYGSAVRATLGLSGPAAMLLTLGCPALVATVAGGIHLIV
ncbi:MAG: hypothetical protein K2X71_07495 [Methylobacterium sp.]|uniref:hypothetical protein n=1 Tax=Methylobacterium sp. TaxID=409 RepID=UPI002587D49F|nr:hypothetical protein [Methylobacterium sp.]MBY0295864.1 hypothetical protein [Methylobacterium sp.]